MFCHLHSVALEFRMWPSMGWYCPRCLAALTVTVTNTSDPKSRAGDDR